MLKNNRTGNDDATRYIESLQSSQTRATAKVEGLYRSLNVDQSFPELAALPFEFVRTLLMARDLKINIRRRAISSFLEWDRLDQAAGGRSEALGVFTVTLHLVTAHNHTTIAPHL